MDRIIAMPMQNGKLCEHFGHCQYFVVAKVENNQIVEMKEHIPPGHVPGLYPKWVAAFGTTDVITGGMGQKAIQLFMDQNINAFVGAPIKDAKNIVEDFINNRLSLSANYCNHNNSKGHGECNK